jgi:hypothetical protein
MDRPEELDDPKKFDELMETVNSRLVITAIPIKERPHLSQILLSDELDYDMADDDSVFPQVLDWYRKKFPGEKIS